MAKQARLWQKTEDVLGAEAAEREVGAVAYSHNQLLELGKVTLP